MTERPCGVPRITNRELSRYVLTLTVGMAVLQGYTAFVAGGRTTVVTGLLLVAVALYMVLYVTRNGTALRTRAYGTYFAHAVAYLIINGSFWLHAWILTLTGRNQVLEDGWTGPLISMSVLWGLGLLVHTIGAMLSRGYEHVEV